MRLDGGLATTLQRAGLPPYTPVNDWLATRPDTVEAAHRAFAEAGANIVLAGTFALWPESEPRWSELTVMAIAHALRGAAGRSAVWASIGPGEPAGAAQIAQRAVAAGAAGIALETGVDTEQLAETVRLTAATVTVPIAATLCARLDGTAWDGLPPHDALRILVDAGASFVGFNCGEGPTAVRAAIDAAGDPGAPLWAKPNRGQLSAPEFAALVAHLDARCEWVGGCCGVTPELIAAT